MSVPPQMMGPPPPDVDIGWQLEVGTTVTFLCACIAVSFRTLARAKYAHIGWDDGLMLFALAQAVVATVFDYLAVDYGLGRHLIYVAKPDAVTMQYWQLLSQVFCINALTFAKISICLSYLRVIRGSQNVAMKWSMYICALLTFVVNTVVIMCFYLACNPPSKAWNPFLPGECWPLTTQIGLVLMQGSWSAVTDFFLAAFPFLLFKDLHVGRKSKAILLGLMSLGVVTCAFAIVRTVEGSAALHAPPTAVPDTSYTMVSGLMWAGMERNIAIMIGSIPAIRPLATPFQRLVSTTFGSRSKTSSYEMGGTKGSSGTYQSPSKGSSGNRALGGTVDSNATYAMYNRDLQSINDKSHNDEGTSSSSFTDERMHPHWAPHEQV